ncbi:MAG TPA: hypothetical protein VNA69_01250 [Thermoanaerobaculia bacterium]|nr:hypothetical protein [Thermoanaerobaculia bacterium]
MVRRFVANVFFAVSLLARRSEARQALRWWRGRAPDYPLRARIPWVVYPALDALERRDLAGAKVFEYGSGGSTLYWVRRGAAQIVSVEHDPAWYDRFHLQTRQWEAIDLRLVRPEQESAENDDDAGDPLAYRSAEPSYRGLRFRRYARTIDEYPDASFDVVMIDGRARPSCIMHAAPKVARGGLLIIDNADRDYYFARTAPFLSGFLSHRFEGPGPVNAMRWATVILTNDGSGV